MVHGWFLYLFCVLGVCIQTMVPNKFLGMLLIMVGLFFALQTMNSIGCEHVLYQIGVPGGQLSDMNGWGHFVEPMVTVGTYWSLWMLLVGIVAHLLMLRGVNDDWRTQLTIARLRFTPPVRIVTGVTVALAAALGAWIYYNTNVLNRYETGRRPRRSAGRIREALQGSIRQLPMPEAVVARHGGRHLSGGASRRKPRRRGRRERTRPNRSARSICTSRACSRSIARRSEQHEDRGRSHPRFSPLRLERNRWRPAQSSTLRWDLSWRNPGFTNSSSATRVVENGTFVDNRNVMPMLGYDPGTRTDRQQQASQSTGLRPVERLPKYDMRRADAASQFGVRTRTTFHAVVSTSVDQIAIAPGYLKSRSHDGDRRYFEYEMDAPIWPFVSFQSARYAVANDRWNDVALQVFYHAQHDFNVARMMEASKKSIDYFTREFSPYQYRQFRILEFPAYETFARVVSEHDSVFRGHRFHRESDRRRSTSTTSST